MYFLEWKCCANVFLGVGMLSGCARAFLRKKIGIHMLAGLATSSQKAGQKKSAKNEFGKFISMEKYIHLLLIVCIWQSPKFNQVGLNLAH
jgi:hypothetical protein